MVLERMKELGYIPNLNAQRLSHGRTYLVALDFGPPYDYLSDMFFVELTRDIQDILKGRGYGVLLSGPGDALDRWVKTQAVDGVILIGNLADETLPQEIACTGTPCVVISNTPVECRPGVGSVLVALRRGAQQAAQLLVESGHRRIGFLATNALDDVYYEFRDELTRYGVTLSEACVIQAGHSPTDGARALGVLLARQEPPTAVFMRTDEIATGALWATHRMGVRIPEDLSIVGHDDIPFAEFTEPPLTTVRVDCVELARLAADTLFSLLSVPNTQMEPQVVHTELVVRDSVSVPRPGALSYHKSVRLSA
jgi:LacI family transcriptional regulator